MGTGALTMQALVRTGSMRRMDYEAIRLALNSVTPFFVRLGIGYESVGRGEAVATLPDDARLDNHIATRHAGALFSLAEAAAGGAFVGALGEEMATILFVARGGEIRYLKVARGPLRAISRTGHTAASLLDRLETEDCLRVSAAVEVFDASGAKVAEGSFHFDVRRGSPTTAPDMQIRPRRHMMPSTD